MSSATEPPLSLTTLREIRPMAFLGDDEEVTHVDYEWEALLTVLEAVQGARWQIEDYYGQPLNEGPLICFHHLARALSRFEVET